MSVKSVGSFDLADLTLGGKMFTETIYIGGYADFTGMAEPVTLVMTNAEVKGGVAATMLCFGLGLLIDFMQPGEESTSDRIAGVIYYASTVSAIALFGWSKSIQSIAKSMDVTGQAIDGALIASAIALVAHVLLLSVIFAGIKVFNRMRPQAQKWLGVSQKNTNRINTKLLIGFPLVALTVPMAAGFSGFFIGLMARAATQFTLVGSSWALYFLGAR